MVRRNRIGLLAVIMLLLLACQPTIVAPTATPVTASTPTAAPTTNRTDGCLESFDPTVDYFPAKITLTETQSFTVEYHKHYKVVTVLTPWQGAPEPARYVLVQCGAPVPEGFAESEIIEVPVMRVVTMSTTNLPFLEQLGVLDRLVGVDDTTYVNNPTVLQMAAEGKLASIGYGANVNVEQALELDPDLIVTYSSGSPDYDAHPKLLEAGLKVALDAAWLERSPLARTEWGKFLALFFNHEALAEESFAATHARYTELASLAAQSSVMPTVFTDTEYQGTWYLPGGQSYAARFLADAGANYLWSDDPATGSVPLAFEAVFDRAQAADVWLNVGFVNTLEELLAADARYADFAAFQAGQVWNNNARVNANGGNDYYESAVAHPDVVLADLIKIFHPELLPDHELVYYRQLQ